MRCRVCEGLRERRVTNLPFKIGDSSIVLKVLPVLQCRQCGDTELEHATTLRVTKFLPGLILRRNWKSSGLPPDFASPIPTGRSRTESTMPMHRAGMGRAISTLLHHSAGDLRFERSVEGAPDEDLIRGRYRGSCAYPCDRPYLPSARIWNRLL